jgi:hypothetical protein
MSYTRIASLCEVATYNIIKSFTRFKTFTQLNLSLNR